MSKDDKATKLKLYMHTIDGCPGIFNGWQIGYAMRLNRRPLPTTLEQIRKERAISTRNRIEIGWDVPKYDYIVVYGEK